MSNFKNLAAKQFNMKTEDFDLITNLQFSNQEGLIIFKVNDLEKIRDRLEEIRINQVRNGRLSEMPPGYGFHTVGFLNNILRRGMDSGR